MPERLEASVINDHSSLMYRPLKGQEPPFLKQTVETKEYQPQFTAFLAREFRTSCANNCEVILLVIDTHGIDDVLILVSDEVWLKITQIGRLENRSPQFYLFLLIGNVTTPNPTEGK